MLIGAGLKMYLGHRETLAWIDGVAELADRHPALRSGAVELVVLPTFPALARAVGVLGPSGVQVGAQDLFWQDQGPFTGEVSGRELAEVGCRYVMVGHAERRSLLGETDDVVAAKTAAAFRNGLVPIVCVGESERTDPEQAAARCLEQLRSALSPARDAGVLGPAVVAYEPVWAIGASAAADPAHITAVCRRLRADLDTEVAVAGSRVVYGGSADAGLLGRLEGAVDGLFLGRASHDVARLEHVIDEAAAAVPQPGPPHGDVP